MQFPSGRTIAFFDFDHTLIEGESFWAFLSLVAGWPRTITAFLEGLWLYWKRKDKNPKDPEIQDMRTFIKAHLMEKLLAGRKATELSPAIKQLHGWMKWNPRMRKALLDHHAKGHHIVIASGGLDLYLMDLLEDLPHDAVICTQVAIKDGIVTSEMITGNCVRQLKAELVAEYIERRGPFGESWGYGNLPHDLPMLQLLKHQIIV